MRPDHVLHRVEQQLSLSATIAKAFENLNSRAITRERVEIRLEDLTNDWEEFRVQHKAITLALSKLEFRDLQKVREHSYFLEDIFSATKDCFLETSAKMSALLNYYKNNSNRASPERSVSQPPTVTSVCHAPRLPRIDLPKFDGTLGDWLSFRDLFTSLVLSNGNISSVEKLQYLKTSLVGSASQLLKNTALTADNFQKAWDSLTSFYENERLLVNSALQSLFSLKKMTKESASEMEVLYTSIMQTYRTLETLKRPVQCWDDIFVFVCVQRLDSESVKTWEHHLGSSKKPPTWSQLRDFLMTRLLSLQAFEKSLTRLSFQPRNQPARSYSANVKPATNKPGDSCLLCKDKHYLSYCPKYRQKPVKQRWEFVQSKGLCFNCLGHHRLSNCQTPKRCLRCGKRHHSTLHQDSSATLIRSNTTVPMHPSSTESAFNTKTSTTEEISKTVNHAQFETVAEKTTALLATAQVKVISYPGESIPARILLDQGSEVSLITEKLAQQLRIPREASNIRVIGVGKQCTGKTKGVVKLVLKPRFESPVEIAITAYVLPKLTEMTPKIPSVTATWPHLQNLLLADPHYAKPGNIDMILGVEIYGHLLLGPIKKGPPNAPVAQATKLGWVISGPITSDPINLDSQSFHCSINQELNDLLERFWHQEEISNSGKNFLSATDQDCENYFASTHSRNSAGKYVVRLPFKLPPHHLGDSKPSATRMLNHMQRKFEKDPTFSQNYSAFLTEYHNLGHMIRVSENEPEPTNAFYLPHHGVIRESSLTTKLRVVFNGSCSVNNGVTLNEILHIGPKLQTDLFDVLIWFRRSRFIYACDIEKMYRQILVHPEDQIFQRILWKEDHKLVQYQLTTVTYGLACAPYLALKAIMQLLKDEGQTYPLAVNVMEKGRYVDDIYGGADTIEEAAQQALQVSQLCMAGGFPLRKWISNNPRVLEVIPTEHHSPIQTKSIQEDVVHALGLSWNTNLDTLHFHLNKPVSEQISKRAILSYIAQFFDPLGLLSPVIIQAKIFLQELWAINLSWDERLPEPQTQTWREILQLMIGLETIEVPRWLGITSAMSIDIHGFCDASQAAMAAVVYVRVCRSPNEIHTAVLCSKTKVAPLKRHTIPRLELSAAVMLTKLVSHTQRVLSISASGVHLWTDSSIVLTWLSHHPSRWKDYVHNRVCFIQETLPQARWRHISGKINPADCATRGLSASQLKNHPLWWTGPIWLSENPSLWPNQIPTPTSKQQQLLEERKSSNLKILHVTAEEHTWDLLYRFSSLDRLFRVTAICKRVLLRAKRVPNTSLNHIITPEELIEAQRFWITIVQQSHFATEIKLLSANTELPKSNPLTRLCPFLDSQKLLRIRGRLEHSSLDPIAKHPYILPRHSALSTLIIRDAHERTIHGSTQDTLSYIRNTYWILGGRTPVRSFIVKCVKCARFRRTQAQQIMGQLPSSRVNPSRAFLHSGVDYAGPFTLKTWKGKSARTYKSWISLFVCLSTSAIHLELVTDYTAEAFMAAYHRFTARRGIPATLTSDCGTNFKGADQQLKSLFSGASTELKKFASLISNDGTKWKFNPPAAPHFGGKWEAGVKSMKYHLKRVTGTALFTYEEMCTLLTRIEAILNSRPLCPLTNDPDDLNVLTPGHFLVGHSLTLIPEPNLTQIKPARLSRWQHICQMVQSFWTKWSRGYLQRFHAIYKWNQPPTPISIGTLVFIIDERYPPSKWPLGRIVQTHPGVDNVVRVVSIKTSTSVLKRPITKICPLPIDTPF